MADMTDDDFKAFKEKSLAHYTSDTNGAYTAYWWYNIVLSVVSIVATTTTSIGVSNNAVPINPMLLAVISWIATAAALVTSSFAIKENKDKYEKLHTGLIAEEAYLTAGAGPYAATKEPRRLFATRVTQLYLGINPEPKPPPEPAQNP